MGDYNDTIANNILLESIDNNIPFAIGVSTSCKKSQNPNKKKTDSSNTSEMESYIELFFILKKNCNKGYIDQYITSLKDQISGLEAIFLRKERNDKNELITSLTAAKSHSNETETVQQKRTCHKNNRDKKSPV